METQKKQGLSEEEVAKRFARFGPNEIKEKKVGFFFKLIKWFISPIALMLFAAAILSLFLDKIFDFYFILFLALLNFFIGFWQEKKADNAIAKLSQKLSVKVKVLRGGTWKWLEAKLLVPDDIIELNVGDIVPADLEILEAKNLNVNEAALTGESLPKEKQEKDKCFSGSSVALGWARARVTAIGKDTYFGHILISIDRTAKRSLLEKDILNISKWLSLLSLLAVIILSAVFLFEGESMAEIITLDLSLVIAGIPVSLPTVMTLIISFGVLHLAERQTIVRRLSALEDIANVNLLLSDKTGTLTKNEIVVEKTISYAEYSEEELVRLASFTTKENDRNPINEAIRQKAADLKLNTEYKIIDFIPFDSVRKRSTAKIIFAGQEMRVRSGAPQIIEPFCDLNEDDRKKFKDDVAKAAEKGYRSVAVAAKKYSDGQEKMKLAGLLLFSDTLEPGAKRTIDFIKSHGIKIKMLSGDNTAIAERIAKSLNIEGEIKKKSSEKDFKNLTSEEFEKSGTFAEILPSDKYDLVNLARQNNYVVAVTGDGMNDLPAIKAADVGIAVKNSVDALKSAADFVLIQHGISVIRNAIIESRKIFARLYAYSVYRISESFRVIITIAALGIVYKTYPLAPIQLIILALLNDIPIISLAFNRVKIASKPSKINARSRLVISILFGLVGTVNSFLFVILTKNLLHYSWDTIQTLFFLKLAVSGHMLIYVAHTKERWYKYLPSKQVIWATFITQIVASAFALTGFLMQKVSWGLVIFVWIWAIFWMQVSEIMKDLRNKIVK